MEFNDDIQVYLLVLAYGRMGCRVDECWIIIIGQIMLDNYNRVDYDEEIKPLAGEDIHRGAGVSKGSLLPPLLPPHRHALVQGGLLRGTAGSPPVLKHRPQANSDPATPLHLQYLHGYPANTDILRRLIPADNPALQLKIDMASFPEIAAMVQEEWQLMRMRIEESLLLGGRYERQIEA